MEQDAMIKLDGLKKYFSITKGLIKRNVTYVKAVDDISLTIKEGEIVGLVGESGSGKTTLARVILSLSKMTGGSVYIDGIDLAKTSRAEMKKLRSEIAVVFQDPASNLNPRQTVESSIMRPMIIHGVPKAEAKKKAKEVLAMVKMDERYLESFPHQLSGGQLQRIAIARALALNPDILCFDEPTSALDPELTGEVLKVIRGLAEKKTTMIIVTHEMDFARNVADQIIFMDDGYIVEQGSAKEVIDNPKEERTKKFLSRYKAGEREE